MEYFTPSSKCRSQSHLSWIPFAASNFLLIASLWVVALQKWWMSRKIFVKLSFGKPLKFESLTAVREKTEEQIIDCNNHQSI